MQNHAETIKKSYFDSKCYNLNKKVVIWSCPNLSIGTKSSDWERNLTEKTYFQDTTNQCWRTKSSDWGWNPLEKTNIFYRHCESCCLKQIWFFIRKICAFRRGLEHFFIYVWICCVFVELFVCFLYFVMFYDVICIDLVENHLQAKKCWTAS